jgi:hypothetical protein
MQILFFLSMTASRNCEAKCAPEHAINLDNCSKTLRRLCWIGGALFVPANVCRKLSESRVARWLIYKPKISIWVNFSGPWNWKCWCTYFMAIWYNLCPFGVVCSHWVYFSHFGIFGPRTIWQKYWTKNCKGDVKDELFPGLLISPQKWSATKQNWS